ncbi:sulfatase-like hydrolase/transferase [Pontiellaceae bacterium B12227]|nr:sulfatase-like hydrolase/transferase [Pontiellaceae bacterium B12227]
MKTTFISFLSIGLIGITSLGAAPERPNILFIFADDWGWGDLSCHDHPYIKTPNIDRLAEEGTDFHCFTVSSGVCSPSRTAVMTGHFPARHAVTGHFSAPNANAARNMPDWVDPNLPMLPRLLQSAGYATAHFGKWHLSNDTVPDSPSPAEYGYDTYGAYNCSGEQMPVHEDAKNAIAFIEKSHEAGKPFFINLWIHEPHTPFHTLPEYRARFPDLEPAHNVYASVLSHADDRIGTVLDTIDRLGVSENTLVIFSSDNGPAGGGRAGPLKLMVGSATGEGFDHGASVGTTGGRKGRKGSLTQGGIGIPFLARWPGRIPSGAIDETSWISAVDLLPTFCEAAGVVLPADYQPDGISQLATLLGEPSPQRDNPLFWKRQTKGSKEFSSGNYAIWDRNWKLLANLDSSQIELYDMSRDPYEKTDLKTEYPEVADELVKKLEAWKATLPAKPDPALFSSARTKKNR